MTFYAHENVQSMYVFKKQVTQLYYPFLYFGYLILLMTLSINSPEIKF